MVVAVGDHEGIEKGIVAESVGGGVPEHELAKETDDLVGVAGAGEGFHEGVVG